MTSFYATLGDMAEITWALKWPITVAVVAISAALRYEQIIERREADE